MQFENHYTATVERTPSRILDWVFLPKQRASQTSAVDQSTGKALSTQHFRLESFQAWGSTDRCVINKKQKWIKRTDLLESKYLIRLTKLQFSISEKKQDNKVKI